MALILDGTNGLTFNNNTVQASAGQVLQVVQGTTTGGSSTTSTSYVTTGLQASITPKFTTSKILVLVSSVCTNTDNNQSNYTLYRGATNLGGGTTSSLSQFFSSSGYQFVPLTINYLDSPATTSSTTYVVYMKGNGGTTYLGSTNILTTITLMEIAA